MVLFFLLRCFILRLRIQKSPHCLSEYAAGQVSHFTDGIREDADCQHVVGGTSRATATPNTDGSVHRLLVVPTLWSLCILPGLEFCDTNVINN